MINFIRKYLTALLFTLLCLSCLSIPSIALSDDGSTTSTPADPQPEEEPECD